ncbi:MAG: HlyD family type I secretion periplasmic adaptor subunit [Boseongicola sp. SB0677_bin_26]|nr:HlyD family type I secretion periplasmic adaptor subunit [Boseongicola sp. SB0677_bin_26]
MTGTPALPDLRAMPEARVGVGAGGYSSRRPLALGFMTLAALAAGLFGWGAATTIAGAVIAVGEVGVGTGVQVVEHEEGGTVEAVLARDGDLVAHGDTLVLLDGAALRSQKALLLAEAVELAAWRNRLEAEYRGDSAITWDAWLAGQARADALVRDVMDGQGRLFEARRASWAGHVAQLRERIGQTRKQVAGLEAQGDAVERERAFVGQELDAQRALFEKGLTVLARVLDLEREAARLEGEAGDIASRAAGARGRIAEIEIAILQVGDRRVEEAERQAREVQARENQVRERLTEVRRRLDGMEVRAPAAGEVHGMEVFAPGEVVRPGEPILRIVPDGAELVVVAQLEPIHADQVRVGQDAVLLFSAFPARITPEYEARVTRLSADAVRDERTGLSWYEMELEVGRALESETGLTPAAWALSLRDSVVARLTGRLRETAPDVGGVEARERPEAAGNGPELALVPGMPVEVHIRTGERTPLSYLAKPLTDYFRRSMRED